MEELKSLAAFVKEYGWSGTLSLYLVWDRLLKPQWRKRVSGEFVHWKDLKKKLDEDNDKIKHIERIVNSQIDKEIEKERRMHTLEIGQGNIEKNVEDLKYVLRDTNGNLKTNNRLLGEVKDALVVLQERK